MEPQDPRSQNEAKSGTSRIEFRYVTREQKVDPGGAAAMGTMANPRGVDLTMAVLPTFFES